MCNVYEDLSQYVEDAIKRHFMRIKVWEDGIHIAQKRGVKDLFFSKAAQPVL